VKPSGCRFALSRTFAAYPPSLRIGAVFHGFLTAPPGSTDHLRKFSLKNQTMKALNTSEEPIRNLDELFHFKRETKQEISLQTWEEENEEYASWNLILDQQDSISC
jgi:hypothetical protein